MSFPSSPLNNQVAIVNNISYKYVSSTNTWNRIATSNVGFYYVTATTLNANNEAYVGGVSILPFAQAAFNAANTISNNITVLQGVDTTQNTNITVIQGVDTAQNTRMSIIESVDVTQNTNITNIDTKAQAAFDKANTAAAGSIDQTARTTANSASSNTIVIQGVDNTQNTNITAVNTYAASAYGAANTNATNITAVNNYAASAYTQANTNATNISIMQGVNTTQNTNITTVTTLAQAAFDKANTGSSGSSVLTSTVDTFTGDGSNTAFTLTVTPSNINYTTAVVGGVSQPRSAYSVVGAVLTFTSAPANGQTIEVTTLTTSNATLYTVNNLLSPFLLMGA